MIHILSTLFYFISSRPMSKIYKKNYSIEDSELYLGLCFKIFIIKQGWFCLFCLYQNTLPAYTSLSISL